MNTEQERAEFDKVKQDLWREIEHEDYAFEIFKAGYRAALQSQDREDAFIDGVLLGLQVIAGSGNAGNADHDELMRSAGIDLVVRRAIDQEMWELAGLDRNQISIKARRRIEDKP